MNSNNKENLTWLQLTERDRSYVERIISDDDFAYYFLHKRCFNLFRKIQWTIFDNDADYDELINSFYVHLKCSGSADGQYWHSLRTFDYRTSLFDWIKVAAVNFFLNPCNEKFTLDGDVIYSGLFEEMLSKLDSSEARKYFYYSYLSDISKNELLDLLQVDSKQLEKLRRRAETALRRLVKAKYPDYYDRMFVRKENVAVGLEAAADVQIPSDDSAVTTNRDIHYLVDSMPNPRYRYVINELFFNDMDSDELAKKMNVQVSNIYNLKSRAIEQLRDMLIYTPGEIEIQQYINRMSDDRLRMIADSIFIKRMEYDAIISQLDMTATEFRRLKRTAMKELKLLFFG